MEKELKESLNKQIEEQISDIVQQGIQTENITMLGKLVDIHKD